MTLWHKDLAGAIRIRRENRKRWVIEIPWGVAIFMAIHCRFV